jgi:hypothetical protein
MKKNWLIFTFFILLQPALAVEIRRLNNANPIIDKVLFEQNGIASDGENINGPCVIRLPDWLHIEKRVHPSANYYLYFGHHHGAYIRMAWAASLTGKWTLYNADSTVLPSKRGVFGLYDKKNENKIFPGNDIVISSHIASPIVLIDNKKEQFVLFFHGQTKLISETKNDQRTFVCYSNNGINFQNNISPVMLGGSYFAPFNYKKQWYSFSNGGLFHEAPKVKGFDAAPRDFDYSKMLWSTRRDFFEKAITETGNPNFRVRHLTTFLENNILHIFFSSSHDTPERIYYTQSILNSDSKSWSSQSFQCVMQAKEVWEGGNLIPKLSEGGAAKTILNEVRDPFIFKDYDGKIYLFYCAGGERGIGMAQVLNFP